ncbi:hypothetical protein L208DRAFT_1398576 [Tricholoma matsutake]|nr:hypothetical protein L208DRAFT_1398576 [Tricholoma matsutake 945]
MGPASSRARHCSQRRAEGWAVIRASARIGSASNSSRSPTSRRTPAARKHSGSPTHQRGGDAFKRVRLLRCREATSSKARM